MRRGNSLTLHHQPHSLTHSLTHPPTHRPPLTARPQPASAVDIPKKKLSEVSSAAAGRVVDKSPSVPLRILLRGSYSLDGAVHAFAFSDVMTSGTRVGYCESFTINERVPCYGRGKNARYSAAARCKKTIKTLTQVLLNNTCVPLP